MSAMCEKPDRDDPRLVCGYPRPCTHHELRAAIIALAPDETLVLTVGKRKRKR